MSDVAAAQAAENPPVADSATSIDGESCPGPSPKSDGGSPGENGKPVVNVEAAAPENLEDFFDNVMFTPSNGICTPTHLHGHMGPGPPPWAAAAPYPMDPAMMPMMPMMYYPYMVPAMPMYYMPVPPPPPPPPPKARNRSKGGKQEHHQPGGKPAGTSAMHGHIAAPPPPPPAHQPRRAAQKASGEHEETDTESAAAKSIATDPHNESAGGPRANGASDDASPGDGTAVKWQGAGADGQEELQGKEDKAEKEGRAPAQGSDTSALPLLSTVASDSNGDTHLPVAEPQGASSRRPAEKPSAIHSNDGSTSATEGSPGKPLPPVFEESAFPALAGSNNTSNAGSTASTPGPNLRGATQAPVWETAALAGVLKAPPAAAGTSTWKKGPAPAVTKPPAADVKSPQASTTAAPAAALGKKASTGDKALQPSTKATAKPPTTMPSSADAPPAAPKTPPQKDDNIAKEEITVAGVQYTWPTASPTSSSCSTKGRNGKNQPLSMSGFPSGPDPQKGSVSEGSAATAVDGAGEVGVLKTTTETLGAVRPEPAAEGKDALPMETAALTKKSKKKKKKSGPAQDLQGPEDDDQWIPVTRGRRN